MKILQFMDNKEYPTKETFETERDYARLIVNVISRTTEEHEILLKQFFDELKTIRIVES